MKRFCSFLALSAFLVLAPPSRAAVPEAMSYQGVLTDGVGNPVPDGLYDLTFTLYDALVGGAPLWSETQSGISVTAGGFSVLLGSVVPLTLPFDASYYLGISVGLDPELVPRIPLASSPYGLGLRLPFTGSVSSAASAFTLDNSGGGPALTITGPSGDAGVLLPANAVSAGETLDEPGVAGATSETATSVGTSLTALLSRTISVPADGYVLAIGNCDLTFFHSVGTVDNMYVGVSTSPSTLPANHDIAYSIGSALTTELYTLPASIQGLFQVSAGTQTFYLLARRTGAGAIAGDKQLTLAYFPTAYGTVSVASAPGAPGLRVGQVPSEGLTPADLEAERREGERFRDDRVRQELESMRAKLRSLERRMAGAARTAGANAARKGGVK